MAVVMTRKFGNAIVHVCDDDYINCTPEELAAREAEMQAVVRRIYANPETRRRLAEKYRLEDEAKAKHAQLM